MACFFCICTAEHNDVWLCVCEPVEVYQKVNELYHVGFVLHAACGHTLVLRHTALCDGDAFAGGVHLVTCVAKSGGFAGSEKHQTKC